MIQFNVHEGGDGCGSLLHEVGLITAEKFIYCCLENTEPSIEVFFPDLLQVMNDLVYFHYIFPVTFAIEDHRFPEQGNDGDMCIEIKRDNTGKKFSDQVIVKCLFIKSNKHFF